MRAITTICFLFLLIPGIGKGQDYVFKVLVSKGANQFKTALDPSWRPMKLGHGLAQGDIIRVVDDAYLGLIHSTGRTTELSEAMEIEVGALEEKSGVMRKGLPSKYTSFVLNTVATEDRTSGSAGTRGMESVQVELPTSSPLYGDKMLFTWQGPDTEANYTVLIGDIFDDAVLQQEAVSSPATLDFSDPRLAGQSVIIVRVGHTSGAVSNEHIISRVTDDEADPIGTEYAEVTEGMDPSSPVTALMKASFFERNELLADAAYHYYQAMVLSGVMEVKSQEELIRDEAYWEFLRRNGLRFEQE